MNAAERKQYVTDVLDPNVTLNSLVGTDANCVPDTTPAAISNRGPVPLHQALLDDGPEAEELYARRERRLS